MTHPTTTRFLRSCPGATLAMLVLSMQATLHADTFTVDPAGGADFTNIGDAVAAARHTDEILLSPGIHRDFDGDGSVLSIRDKSLTIRGIEGADETIIEYTVLDDGPAFGRAVQLANDTEVRFDPIIIEGVTIRPNAVIDPSTPVIVGAAIDIHGFRAEFRECRFEGNVGLNYIQCHDKASLFFWLCTFENNADIMLYDTHGRFDWCTFTRGGAILGVNDGLSEFGAVIDCFRCQFHEQGTSIRLEDRSILLMSGSEFWNGLGDQPSLAVSSGSMATVSGSRFHSSRNPAIEVDEANLILSGSEVDGHPLAVGPRVRVGGEGCDFLDREYQVEIRSTKFRDGTQGAIGIKGAGGPTPHRVLMKLCRFEGNAAINPGAAISIADNSLDVDHCIFTNNDGGGNGDAIAISGDDRGSVRIMNSTFTDNGSGGTGITVYNDGLDQVQCFGNRFCGDSGDPLGGSAMSVWSNLLAGACWEEFPNPRGIAMIEDSPALEVTTETGPNQDQHAIAGDVGRTAFAESSFSQFSASAEARATATVEDATPTEYGMDYSIRTSGRVGADAGGGAGSATARSRVRFTNTLQVSTERARALFIDLTAEADSPWNQWDVKEIEVEVRQAGGGVLSPSFADPASGGWRYDLPAGGNFSIDLSFDCTSLAIVSGDEVLGGDMEELLQARVEFRAPGSGGGEDEDDEEEDEKTPSEDLNGDGRIDGADLAAILLFWGSTDPAHDLNGDGQVNGGDFATVLAAWN